MVKVLVADFLKTEDLRADSFVSPMLQLFLLADSVQSRTAAALIMTKLTPSTKHLSCLEVATMPQASSSPFDFIVLLDSCRN